MRLICLTLLSAVLAGCASSPPVVLPKTTEFDDNPKARAAFLKAYREGYLAQLSGQSGVICLFGRDGIVGTAREIGWMDGQSAASAVILQQRLRGVETRSSK